jgi:hypothetical protein
LATLIQRVKRGIARLIDAYEEGLLDKMEFEPRIRGARERLSKLEAEARAQAERSAQEEDLRLVIGQLEEFAERVREGLNDPDWTTRREIIRALVKRVEIDAEEVRVVYKVSPLPFAEGPERGRLQDCGRRDQPPAGERLPAPCAGRRCQWTRTLTRLLNPNCYEPDSHFSGRFPPRPSRSSVSPNSHHPYFSPDGGFLQGLHLPD